MRIKIGLFYHNPTTLKAGMSVSREPISAIINHPADRLSIPFSTLIKFRLRMIPDTGETIVKAIFTGFILTILSTSDVHAESKASPEPLPGTLKLDLQRRMPETDHLLIQSETINSRRIGIVVIDMWNGYMCPTGSELFGNSLITRMNHALEGARQLGMVVIHAPSDVADLYAGWPQAEKVAALPRYELPEAITILSPRFPDSQDACLCGPGLLCRYMHSWDAIHPQLLISESDYILVGAAYGDSGTQRLHAICRDRNLTHLIYAGCATNCCVVAKAAGALYMAESGIQVLLARDLTEAVTRYDPSTGYTPDDGTSESVRAIERASFPTIDLASELKKVALWKDHWITDPVHMFPHWSKPREPYLFEDSFIMTLSTPRVANDTIHYTKDGSEPSPETPRYTSPLKMSTTGVIRAQSFRNGLPVSLESKSYHHRLIPNPPKPDLALSDIVPIRATAPGYLHGHTSEGIAPNIQFNRSFTKQSLRLQGRIFNKGIGVHAPSQLLYKIKPEYKRFVALAGIDDQILDHDSGMHVAHLPSVVFRIFIDGKLISESPVMRTGRVWRFNIPIAIHNSTISLATMDATDGRFQDIASWVDAGFTLRKP